MNLDFIIIYKVIFSECPGSRQIIWKHISRSSAKRKGGQIRFTNEQTTTLENTFSEHKYLSSSERKRLATVLRLSERQVSHNSSYYK